MIVRVLVGLLFALASFVDAAEVPKPGWIVVDMQEDWAVVYPESHD